VRLAPISQRQFAVYAISLPKGPNFGPLEEVSWWADERRQAVGLITFDPRSRDFGCLALRRDVDHRFRVIPAANGLSSLDAALKALEKQMRIGEPPEPRPSGEQARRNPFHVEEGEVLNEKFLMLCSSAHHFAALHTIAEVYFALDRPDQNFVGDFQTEGFDARLWELYLFAAFREQGIEVRQDLVSPDYRLNHLGLTVLVEAVTANPAQRMQPLWEPAAPAPADRIERTLGAPAERFAKSLRSKMDKRYWERPQAIDKPLVLAIADFHQSGSMTWSSHALQSYLYGLKTMSEIRNGEKRAWSEPIYRLQGSFGIPAGFFVQPDSEHISAVIGCNAATLGKFNRMGHLAGWKAPGLRMERSGILFCHSGNRLEPTEFCFDIDDPAYERLWPYGELWCLELEVYHNPNAVRPIPRQFFPGATHFFEREGEIVFEGPWEHRILSSVTALLPRKP